MGSLTRELVRRVRDHEEDEADRGAAQYLVRDWFGSFVAGGSASTGRILRSYAGEARDLDNQVFLASALSHVTETDDLHRTSVTHPGCVVIPTSLLLARDLDVRGHDVLRAVLVGYEVMIRVGESLGPAHYRTFHNTATAGVFGAAAAAAQLLDLDEEGWVWALGNAGTQAAGLWQFNEEGAMSKPLHVGHAASAGLRAALLAVRGLTGPEAILEGGKGLFRALCPDADPGAVVRDTPGWKLPETSVKPYPCCRHVHPAVDAALELRERLESARFASIRIQSYAAALRITDRPRPSTPEEARFSIQYAVATALLRGWPRLDAFDPAAVHDEEIRRLLSSISVETSPSLDTAYPERWGAAVQVETDDGTVERAERSSARGDPECPLSGAALDDKIDGLLRWAGLTPGQREAALAEVHPLILDGPVPDVMAFLVD